MYSDFLKRNNVKSQAKYVELGYGQVEPNHLSAQRTSQIYAQLPANKDISILEQGQFVKYDYAASKDNGIGEVNFTGEGEWMLVYNEPKLYREIQRDCEFAMIKDNYQARVYSPAGINSDVYKDDVRSIYLNGRDATIFTVEDSGATIPTADEKVYVINGKEYDKSIVKNLGGGKFEIHGRDAHTFTLVDEGAKIPSNNEQVYVINGKEYDKSAVKELGDGKFEVTFAYDSVLAPEDIYEISSTTDPFKILAKYHEKMMPAGTSMVPRVFKTNVGDIFTTNMVDEDELVIGDILAPKTGADGKGILAKDGDTASMKWQVVKVYTMPDHQKGVKIMRIA